MTTNRKRICVSQQDIDLLATMCSKIESITQRRCFLGDKKYYYCFVYNPADIKLAQQIFSKYHIDMDQHKSGIYGGREPKIVLRVEQQNVPVYAKSLFKKIKQENLQLTKPENESRYLFMQTIVAHVKEIGKGSYGF